MLSHRCYNLVTHALIRREASGLEWLSADRGLPAARAAGNPLTLAAASHLDISGARPALEHPAMYGMLHCSAAYLLGDAGSALAHAGLSALATRVHATP